MRFVVNIVDIKNREEGTTSFMMSSQKSILANKGRQFDQYSTYKSEKVTLRQPSVHPVSQSSNDALTTSVHHIIVCDYF